MAKLQEIIQGEDAVVQIQVVDQNGDPFSLAGLTGASGYFTGALIIPGVLISEDLGTMKFVMTEVQTPLLEVNEDGGSFEVVIDQGSNRTIVQFIDALVVKARLF